MSAPALSKIGASRRGFLKRAGMLIDGFNIAGDSGKLLAQSTGSSIGLVDATQVDSWLSIAADGSITIYSGKIEFGQGFSTVQTQLVAEELFVPLTSVTIVVGETGTTPDQGITSGSHHSALAVCDLVPLWPPTGHENFQVGVLRGLAQLDVNGVDAPDDEMPQTPFRLVVASNRRRRSARLDDPRPHPRHAATGQRSI